MVCSRMVQLVLRPTRMLATTTSTPASPLSSRPAPGTFPPVLPNDETKGTAVEKDELGMMEFPQVGDKATGPTTGVDFGLSVNKDSKKKEAAMKFIEFMTTGEGQQEWINTLQGAPVDKDMKVEVPSDATESAKASIDLVTKGQASSKLERKLTSQELNDEIGVQMQNIYTGDATVDSALKAIQQVNESIEGEPIDRNIA